MRSLVNTYYAVVFFWHCRTRPLAWQATTCIVFYSQCLRYSFPSNLSLCNHVYLWPCTHICASFQLPSLLFLTINAYKLSVLSNPQFLQEILHSRPGWLKAKAYITEKKIKFWMQTFFSGQGIHMKDAFCKKNWIENFKPGRSSVRSALPPCIWRDHQQLD